MNVVKMIGMILLAAYLILMGLSTMSEISMNPMAQKFVDLLGVGSGVLILVSIGKFAKKDNR